MRVGILTALVVFFVALNAFAGQQPSTEARSKPARETSPSKLPSEDEIDGFLRQMFGYDRQLSWKVASIRPSKAQGLTEVTVQFSGPQGQGSQKFYVTEDGKHAVTGEVIPFGPHPFEEARQALEKKVNGPARGPVGAPVTIVEFSDLQCPHCKEANPTIEKLLTEVPNVRFIFQSFPLPMHNWAEKGAAYADCVARASSDAFWKFIDQVYGAQSDITADNADQKLSELADKSGVKGADTAACAGRPETGSRVEASVNLGKSLDVNATPTLFINGRPAGVSGNNYEVLKQLVDFASQK